MNKTHICLWEENKRNRTNTKNNKLEEIPERRNGGTITPCQYFSTDKKGRGGSGGKHRTIEQIRLLGYS